MKRLGIRTSPTLFINLLGICLLLSSLTPGAASAQQMAQCSDNLAQSFVVQGFDCKVYEVDETYSCSQMCPPMAMQINNIGFRSSDGMIYGVELMENPDGNNGIVRLDPRTCAAQTLAVSGLNPTHLYDAGDISPDGRWMFINAGGFSPLWVVDLSQLHLPTLTAVPVPFTGDTGAVHDWAYNPKDGLLYGGDNWDGELAVLDPALGVRSDSGLVDTGLGVLPDGISYGGAWFRDDGKLVLYRNSIDITLLAYSQDPYPEPTTGAMYVIDLENPTGPTIVHIQNDVGSHRNDAAPCIDCGAYAFHERDCHLVHYEPTGSVGTHADLCGDMGMEVNNAGFWNGLIYAVELTRFGNNGLVAIDPASGCAAPVWLGFPQGWDRYQRFDAGDVSPEGILFVNRAGLNPLFKVDLTQTPLKAERITMTGSTGYVHDWAYNPVDGRLYGGDTAGQLAVMDTLGHRVDFALVDTGNGLLPSGIAFGGAWFAADGYLVLHRNNGELYRIDVSVPTVIGPPAYGRNSTGFNDATRCTGWVEPQ